MSSVQPISSKCTNQKVSALDQHPYLAFGQQNNNPWDVQVSQSVLSLGESLRLIIAQIKTVCGWGGGTNDSQSSYGIILGGEWSNAINDCGKWLDGVDSTPAYTAVSNCTQWDEWFDWSDDTRAGLLGYSSATMDSLQNWFFWTWKIGNSTELGYPPSPFWHYKLGWQNGWIPADPRTAGGYCSRVAGVGGSQVSHHILSDISLDPKSWLTLWPPVQRLFPGVSYRCSRLSYYSRRGDIQSLGVASNVHGTFFHRCTDRSLSHVDSYWRTYQSRHTNTSRECYRRRKRLGRRRGHYGRLRDDLGMSIP